MMASTELLKARLTAGYLLRRWRRAALGGVSNEDEIEERKYLYQMASINLEALGGGNMADEAEKTAITDAQSMRLAAMSGIDGVLNEILFSRFMSSETRRMWQGLRDFLQQADAVAINQLYALFCKEP